MSSFKMQPISHSEYLSGKYRDVSTISGKHEAKVWYKDNGSINEDSTYSDSYLRANGLGRYAKKAESSSKSSSSKSSSSKSSSGSKNSSGKQDSSKAKKVEVEVEKNVYVDVEVPATDEERLEYIYMKLSNEGDYNELKKNALIAKAESLGLDATELLEKMEKKLRIRTDYEYAISNKEKVSNVYPPKEREELMKYIAFMNKKYNGNWHSNAVFNLDLVVTLHYENDAELRNIVDELKKNSEYYQEHSPFGTPVKKPNLAESLINLSKTFKYGNN